jgi:ribosomal protein L34E
LIKRARIQSSVQRRTKGSIPSIRNNNLRGASKNKKPGTTGYPGALGHEVTRGMIKNTMTELISLVKQNSSFEPERYIRKR